MVATSHLNKNWTQAELQTISEELVERFDDIIDEFELDIRKTPRMYIGCCPIHGGDNQDSLNFYHSGHTHSGNWYCNTHQCESVFVSSPIGFIRGLLSRRKHNWDSQGDTTASFFEAVVWSLKFLGKDIGDLNVNYEGSDLGRFTSHVNSIWGKQAPEITKTITREEVIASLEIPASFYYNRGYTLDILEKYDVGLCNTPNKPMYQRIVFPIYDDTHKWMIGCTGRSMWPKCNKCNLWHDPRNCCPDPKWKWQYSKWRHSSNFNSEFFLYNMWKAKPFVAESGIALIVESPGNVLRLEEAGFHNSVGTFGAKLSDGQKIWLDSSGAFTLVVLTDPDDAGIMAAENIRKLCEQQYNVIIPELPNNRDIGDLTVMQVREILDPIFDKYRMEL